MMNKRKIMIFGAIGFVLLLIVLLVLQQRAQTPDDKSFEYTDPDTGEVIEVKPGVTDEKFGETGDQTILIGLTSLAGFGSISLNQNQLPIFRDDLLTKGIKTVGSHEKIIKVVRPEINQETYKIEADLILNKDAAPGRLVFDIPDNYEFRYEIWMNGKKVYDSGRLFTNNVGEFPPEDH